MSKLQKLVPMAQKLGLSSYALRQGARKGLYPHLVIAGKYFFDEDVMQRFLEREMDESLRGVDRQEGAGGLSELV